MGKQINLDVAKRGHQPHPIIVQVGSGFSKFRRSDVEVESAHYCGRQTPIKAKWDKHPANLE
jgi:hypothetical protein